MGVTISGAGGVSAHSSLTGLTTGDDHTQYALLAGRSGGQVLYGGTGSGDNLQLLSTSHATMGKILIGANSAYDDVNERLGIGTTSPGGPLALVVTGTYSTPLQAAFNISGTMTASSAQIFVGNIGATLIASNSNSQIFRIAGIIDPQAASLTLFSLNNNLTIGGSSSNTVSIIQANNANITKGASFTGTVTNGYNYFSASPASWGTTSQLPGFAGFFQNTVSHGHGTTSGTVTNYGINIATMTAAAASGGTLINASGRFTVSNGSGAGTNTNYGIIITGNGGSGGAGTTTNWALYSDSTANSYMAGKFGLATTTPSNIFSIGGNAARIIGLERHTTANTAGNTLTVTTGGATSGATDKAGGNLIVQSGIGTGNATPSRVDIQAPASGGSSGTTDQPLVTRIGINSTASLTSGSATTLCTIPLATLQSAGGLLVFGIDVGDGTDVIQYTSSMYFSAVNKGGVYTTASTSLLANNAKSDVADTYSVAFSFNNGTNQTQIQITPTLTGMTPTYHRITHTFLSFAQQDITF